MELPPLAEIYLLRWCAQLSICGSDQRCVEVRRNRGYLFVGGMNTKSPRITNKLSLNTLLLSLCSRPPLPLNVVIIIQWVGTAALDYLIISQIGFIWTSRDHLIKFMNAVYSFALANFKFRIMCILFSQCCCLVVLRICVAPDRSASCWLTSCGGVFHSSSAGIQWVRSQCKFINFAKHPVH